MINFGQPPLCLHCPNVCVPCLFFVFFWAQKKYDPFVRIPVEKTLWNIYCNVLFFWTWTHFMSPWSLNKHSMWKVCPQVSAVQKASKQIEHSIFSNWQEKWSQWLVSRRETKLWMHHNITTRIHGLKKAPKWKTFSPNQGALWKDTVRYRHLWLHLSHKKGWISFFGRRRNQKV